MNSKFPSLWAWFHERVLPGLFVATSVGVAASLWLTYNTTQQVVGKVAEQQRDLARLESRMSSMEASTATKAELSAALQIVGQQIEIAMLKAGVKLGPVKLDEPSRSR